MRSFLFMLELLYNHSMKSRILSLILISFVIGIWLAPFFNFDFLALCILGLGFMVLAFILKPYLLKTIFICLAFFLFAIFRFDNFDITRKPDYIGRFFGEEVEISGVIDGTVEDNKVNRYLVLPRQINGKENINGNLLVTARKYPEYKFGDKIILKGILTEPEKFDDFDYKSYLARKGVFAVMAFPDVEKSKSQYIKKAPLESFSFFVKQNLNNLRVSLESSVSKTLPEPHASFMNALLTGNKSSIPDWLLEDFKKTGTSHIIALSGFNITIIIFILRNLTKGLSRNLSFLIPILAIVLFIILTGAEASVVRAGIMGSMFLMAKRFGRQSDSLIAMVFVAAIMIFANPLILRFDVGFQLSFAALVGIVYLAPLFDQYFEKIPNVISENLSLTIGAQIVAAPILLYNFKQISFISPIVNVFVLPLIPLAMLLGFFAGTVNLFSNFLGHIFGYFSYGVLAYIIKTVSFFSNMRYSSTSLSFNSPISGFIYYFLLADIYLFIKKSKLIKYEK